MTTTRVLLVAAAIGLAGCADFSSPADPTGGLPDVLIANPSLRLDIQPIFTARCAQGGCHTPASAQGGLVLTAGQSYSPLGERRLEDGKPRAPRAAVAHAKSYLWMVIGSNAALHPSVPECRWRRSR